MSTRDVDCPDHPSDQQDELYRLVSVYQHRLKTWLETSDRALRAALLVEQSLVLEQLYAILAEPLRGLVRGWTGSLIFQESLATRSYNDALESLAMSAFGDIAAALPRVQVQAGRNLRSYLIQIARHKLSDQMRKVYGRERVARSVSDHSFESGDPDARMWPPLGAVLAGVWGQDEANRYLADPVDPSSADLDDVLVVLYEQQLLQEIMAFFQTRLSETDRQIAFLRWSSDKPMHFEAIAQHLGPGWTAAAVRKRYQRIVERLQKYLVEQKLVDPDG